MTNERLHQFIVVPEVINFMHKICINSENERMVRRFVLELLSVYDTGITGHGHINKALPFPKSVNKNGRLCCEL
jgi:hypothetical protein